MSDSLYLKPHVRHQRVYGMGTSGFMLSPVTPPTQCVAECAKCWFSGQANTVWGPLPKRSPIQNGRPSYIGAYVRTLFGAPRRVRIGIGVRRRDWLCDGGWTLGMGQWEIHIFLRRDQSLTYGNGEFARTQISLRNDLRTAFAFRNLRLKYVYICQAREALKEQFPQAFKCVGWMENDFEHETFW